MSTATAEQGDVPTAVLLACVLSGVAVGVAGFALTQSLAVAIVGYIVTACFSYALTWVMQ